MRFSPELVQVKVSDFLPGTGVLTGLLHLLADEQVNISFLSLDRSFNTQASLCVAQSDFLKVEKLIDGFLSDCQAKFEYHFQVGTLSLFPHKSQIRVIAQILSILGQNKIPVYGLGSSISAIVINTDYHRLDDVAELLQQVFQLPEQYTPFRQHLVESVARKEKGTCQNRPLVETAAKYWEEVIRIYGSNIKTNLELVTLNFSEKRLADVGSRLQKLENDSQRFEFIVDHQIDKDNHQLVIIYDSDKAESLSDMLQDFASSAEVLLTKRSPVELVYLHGPHFQDRFGVADATLGNLRKHQIDVFLAGCAGTSIYLVIPHKMAKTTVSALATVFSVPNSYGTS